MIRERRSGAFRRSFALPEEVDADQISATFKDGLLTLTVPKTGKTQARQIAVKSSRLNGTTPQVEGSRLNGTTPQVEGAPPERHDAARHPLIRYQELRPVRGSFFACRLHSRRGGRHRSPTVDRLGGRALSCGCAGKARASASMAPPVVAAPGDAESHRARRLGAAVARHIAVRDAARKVGHGLIVGAGAGAG